MYKYPCRKSQRNWDYDYVLLVDTLLMNTVYSPNFIAMILECCRNDKYLHNLVHR